MESKVSNTVSGGNQYAPVVQSGEITNLTFTATPAPAPAAPANPQVQHNTASDDGTIYAVGNGDLHVHHHHGGEDPAQ
ncbi:hypothetical protein KGQ20_33235 [Catenulispora sp. NF23]|uniref:Uncharacterized protein n=1 Tax=Catenulispora pinistramenti TaxID=2705254 RepID=A0ABS5KQ35_9ACTN|nr:hypothetical protein [Catenulispora pinistramenti]MBS2537627.1 hypothetical protein [Catenulispora pinistramenti]MBS2548136.1 hypothetical protein [Catenulispora pinistramenti]